LASKVVVGEGDGPGPGLKEAFTVFAVFIQTEQGPIPEQAPDQPMKTYPTAGVAVRLTVVPVG